MSAQVLPFPPTRTCRLCQHFMPYEDNDDLIAGRCQLLDKAVSDVHEVATRCPSYEQKEVLPWRR